MSKKSDKSLKIYKISIINKIKNGLQGFHCLVAGMFLRQKKTEENAADRLCWFARDFHGNMQEDGYKNLCLIHNQFTCVNSVNEQGC